MSVVNQPIVVCDGRLHEKCEITRWLPELLRVSGPEQRAVLASRGWEYYRRRDYCPACWPKVEKKETP